MAYNLVDSHQFGSPHSHCVTGNLTSTSDGNLVVAKSTRIELFLVTSKGLRQLKEILLYGRVALMKAFRSSSDNKDLLFILSNKYNVAVIEFVRNSDSIGVLTRAHGHVAEPTARPVSSRPLCAIDPNGKVAALSLFDGFLKVIPLDKDNKELVAFNIRMSEHSIWDLQFLHDHQKPTLAVIHEDKNCRQLKTYELSLTDRELMTGPFKQDNLESRSGVLIAVSQPFGGVLVVGQQSIVYVSTENKYCAIASSPLRQSTITSYSKVDDVRYLLSDLSGRLFLLELRNDGRLVSDIKLELMGDIKNPECFSYLDNCLVYIGGRAGSSQLIKLSLEPNQNDSHLEVIETMNNSEPFDDMMTLDIDRHRQGSLTNASAPLREEFPQNTYMSFESAQKSLADNRHRKPMAFRSRSQSVDCQSIGGIFDIDIEVEDQNAFDSNSFSDEEDDGSDDSVAIKNSANDFNSRGRNISNSYKNAQNNQSMAYSLPIQVPKWKNFHRHEDSIDDKNLAMIPNGEAIGESIKKLAKSVRNDSEIFGDRPRRRTNTVVDIIKSRPM